MTIATVWTQKGDTLALLATFNNFTAVTDPVAASDGTQGYSIGSVWFNSAAGALRWWECQSSATGAAVWVFSGAAYAQGGCAPNSESVQFGSGTALASAEGNVFRFVNSPGASPGTTGNDNVLSVYSIPANSFDVANRGLTITAAGAFGATGNSKTLKLIFNPTTAVVGSAVTGGTLMASTGVITTNGGGWWISANVFKYGASGSNTQICTSNGSIAGTSHGGTTAPLFSTAVESAAILVAITGNAATVTSDILMNWGEINAMN